MDKDPNIYSVIILILLFSSIILGRRWLSNYFKGVITEKMIFFGSILLCVIIFFTVINLWGIGGWVAILIGAFCIVAFLEIMGIR